MMYMHSFYRHLHPHLQLLRLRNALGAMRIDRRLQLLVLDPRSDFLSQEIAIETSH